MGLGLDLRPGAAGAEHSERGFGWISHTAELCSERRLQSAPRRRQPFSHCHFAATQLHRVVLNRRRTFLQEHASRGEYHQTFYTTFCAEIR